MKTLTYIAMGILLIAMNDHVAFGSEDQDNKDRAGDTTEASVPAFPGAQGFGADTPGGRGGRVIAVTSLDAEGPGTLQAALQAKGPRIVVFHVGGTIELQGDISITEPFITVAGQTAPGDGVCIRGGGIVVRTHDVVIRHFRIRVCDQPEGREPGNRDGLFVSGKPGEAYNVVIDHCSVSWAIDETVGTWYGPTDVTFQWCLISESLHDSLHPEGPHGMGVIFGSSGGQRLSMHHCLIAHHNRRHPRISVLQERNPILLDFRNNVIYNFGNTFGIFLGRTHANYIGNTVQKGADSRDLDHLSSNAEKMYLANNVLTWRPQGLEPSDDMTVIDRPLETAPVTTHAPDQAYELILRHVGATRPVRDVVDDRVIQETRNREGRFIDSQRDVGGWAHYAGGEAPPDSDGDGMPDAWERAQGLNPNNAGDGALDLDGDVYTNVEEYLNQTDPENFEKGIEPAHSSVRVQTGNEELRGASARRKGRQLQERAKRKAVDPDNRKAFLAKWNDSGKEVADFLDMPFVPIEGQTFMMERDDEFDWGPVEVTLSPYEIAKYEVTQKQWTTVVGTQPWSGRTYAKNDPTFPASYISWNDCQVFVERLNAAEGPWRYSLPSEAQWECVARAGTGLLFGIQGDDGRIASDEGRHQLAEQTWSRENTIEEGKEYPQPVGQLQSNPWGVFDLAGNVNEWCQDGGARWYWYDIEAISDPPGPDGGTYRVTRGKSFYRPLAGMLWYSATPHRPSYRTFETGFRLVRTRR
jgi:formylglycine-generating enzyme required for sulfatase activity